MKNIKPKYKISLIIPAYNEEKYIGECLDYAIKNSNNKFFEIIVVDNASTDNTRMESLKRPGVKVVREEKKGLTRARQSGYLEAKGNLFAYIDADTRMPKNWVDRVIKEFEKDANLVCLSGPYVYYDISKLQQFFTKIYCYLLVMPAYWIFGYMVFGGNFIIKKEVLDKMSGFDTMIEFYGEDVNIARRSSAFGKVKFMPQHYIDISGRRLTNQGALSIFKEYVLNFLSEVFLHKPATKEYKDFR